MSVGIRSTDKKKKLVQLGALAVARIITIALLVRPRCLLLVLAALGLTDFCSSSDIASSSLLSLSPQRTGFSSHHL
jgi:hypothetical protein